MSEDKSPTQPEGDQPRRDVYVNVATSNAPVGFQAGFIEDAAVFADPAVALAAAGTAGVIAREALSGAGPT